MQNSNLKKTQQAAKLMIDIDTGKSPLGNLSENQISKNQMKENPETIQCLERVICVGVGYQTDGQGDGEASFLRVGCIVRSR